MSRWTWLDATILSLGEMHGDDGVLYARMRDDARLQPRLERTMVTLIVVADSTSRSIIVRQTKANHFGL